MDLKLICCRMTVEAGNGSSNEERGTDCEDTQSTNNKGAENDTDW